MATSTWAAYIYDATSGLAKRVVVSDDYRTPAALMAAHCAAGEAALVVEYDGTLDENRVDAKIAQLDDDGVQAIVTAHCKIDPPPKLKYALTGPTGRIFEIIETRVVDDPRLQRHAAFEAAKATKVEDLTAAVALVAQYPDLELLPSKSITQAMLDAHDTVRRAEIYGLIDDAAVRLDPTGDSAQKVGDRLAGFTVQKSEVVAVGDKVLADGSIRKIVTDPVPVEQPIVGEIRLVL